MTTDETSATIEASDGLRSRLRRHKLVFVQCGAAFGGFRSTLIERLEGQIFTAEDFATSQHEHLNTRLILTGLEVYASEAGVAAGTLGELRVRVSEAIDNGCEVCLVSTAPRASYPPIPGSSLLDDASAFFLDLSSPEELSDPGNVYPPVLAGELSISDLYRTILLELGFGVLASLDRAIFDSQLDRESFIAVLDPREIEALRGASLVGVASPREFRFLVPQRFGEFREALSEVLADHTEPQEDLAFISAELWRIERSMRKAVRTQAISKFGHAWRGNILHGDLPQKVLERALVDGSVGTRSIKELRDPIEWLSLGELLEVINTTTFDKLGLPNVFWARFAQEILPIRNRLSHMRHFKTGDRSAVMIWSSQLNRMLPR